MTNLTQKWVKTPSSNNGVILWATNEDVNAGDLRYYSSEHENKPPQLMIIWSNQPKTVYFLKDHLGSIRVTVLDSAGAAVCGYDDYDPWGYILAGRRVNSVCGPTSMVTLNKFTGKEWDDDLGLNWNYFGVSPAFEVAVVVARVARSRQLLDFFAQKVAHLLQCNRDEKLDHSDFGIGRQGALIVIPPACLHPRWEAGHVLRLHNLLGHFCPLSLLDLLEDRSHLRNLN